MKIGSRSRLEMTFRIVILLFVVGLVSSPLSPAHAAEKLPIGGKSPDFGIRDRWFLSRSLSELKYRAVVMVIMDPTCPLVKRLIPMLNELQMRLWSGHQDALVLGAFIDPHETPQSIQDYALFNHVSFPVVKLEGDTNGKGVPEVLAELGLDRLSSVILFGENKEILYRGRFSDKLRLTGFVEGGRDHLNEALRAYLEGRPISPGEVQAEGCLIERQPAEEIAKPVSWKDVAPIFSKHCVSCHRPGGGAPFALTTYQAAARKARTIARVVSDGQMPPWYASPVSLFPFLNENRLDEKEKRLLADWVKSGTPGPATEALEATSQDFPTPDRVYLSREIKVPATGKIPYVNIPIFTSLANEDRWVSAIRIVPTNPRVVHHANLAYVRGMDILSGVPYKNFITGYVPGVSPMILEPGVALKIPGRSFLGLQVHVVTTGVEETTQIRVEVKFTDQVSRRLRFHYFNTANLSIPPEHPYYEVKEDWVTPDDIEIVGAFAHMHYRGKDFHLTVREGEKTSTLLAIPNYQYDWQMGYQWPIGKVFASRGSEFSVTSHFENSRFNVYNPNPLTQVSYGEQSDDEMMVGFLFYLLKVEDLGRDT